MEGPGLFIAVVDISVTDPGRKPVKSVGCSILDPCFHPSRTAGFLTRRRIFDHMNKLIGVSVLSLLFLAGCATPSATGPQSTGGAAKAAGPQVAGDYAGNWTGSDGMAGEVRLSLKNAGNGLWEATVVISAQGTTVPTTMESVNVDQSKVELLYRFEAEGANSKVKMTGKLEGAVLAGDYQVSSIKKEKVTSTGTWTTTRAP